MYARKGKKLPTPEWMIVTPEMAKEWLSVKWKANGMVTNRIPRKSVIDNFVRDIQDGLWNESDGNPISLGSRGEVYDGQHRLRAIIESDTAIWCLILHNAPRDNATTTGRGNPKGVAHILQMSGLKNYTCLASALSEVFKYKQRPAYFFTPASAGDNGDGANRAKVRILQPNRALAFMDTLNQTIEDDVNWVMSHAKDFRILGASPGRLAAAIYLCGEKDKEKAELFFEKLRTGIGLLQDDPVLALRKRLLNYRAECGRVGSQIDGRLVSRMIAEGWNAFLTGSTPRFTRKATRGIDFMDPNNLAA